MSNNNPARGGTPAGGSVSREASHVAAPSGTRDQQRLQFLDRKAAAIFGALLDEQFTPKMISGVAYRVAVLAKEEGDARARAEKN